MRRRSIVSAWVMVTGSAIAWSTAGYFTRLIPLDNWTLLFCAASSRRSAIFIFMLMKDGRGACASSGSLRGPGWLFTIISGGGMMVYITSLTLTTVAHVAIIYCIVPFVAAGLAFLAIGERPSPTAIVASLIALVGVAVMVGLSGGEGRSPATSSPCS